MKLNLSIISKAVRFLASFTALFTMVMSPVAMGREVQQKITVKQLQDALDQAGMNRQITVGEFYKKNKALFPPRVQKEMDPFVAAFKNQMMPQFEVVATKGTDGVEVPTLRVSQNGELINVQMFGDSEKYAKIQNTFVSEIDVINFDDMFKRVLAGDETIRKKFQTSGPTTSTFTGYPDLTVATWHKMTQKERAGYIINMRLLWNDARRVLVELEKKNKKSRKTSSIDSTIQKWDQFFAMISPEANAESLPKPKGVTSVKPAAARKGEAPSVKAGAGSSAFVSGSNCIIAGYVSKYSATKCGIENMFDSYKDNPENNKFIDDANKRCSSGQVACNPFVYGTPGGNPICVSTSDPSFQIATHYDGPCDSQSRLGSKVDFLKEDLKNGSRYSDENRTLTEEQLKAKYEEEQKANPKLVENYLNGILAFKSKAGVDFKQALTDDVINELLAIKNAFDTDIGTAKGSCEAAAKNKNNEKNFWGACDQLHRRFLNVAQFLETTPGCPDKGKINPDTLKCACPAPAPEALPGTTCSTPQPPPVCPPTTVDKPATQQCVPTPNPPAEPPPKPEPPKDCASLYPGAVGLTDKCMCPGGGEPKSTDKAAGPDDPKTFSCAPDKPTKPGDNGDNGDCGILCSVGKFLHKFALPIIGTIAGVYLLNKLLTPKKSSIKNPGDICPNGMTPPCIGTCVAPQVMLPTGLCGCASCPPGQTISNAATCTCSTTTNTPITYTCPDGVTKVDDLAKCPATTYTCWDGSKVTNPLNCPERPNSTNTNRTGKSKK